MKTIVGNVEALLLGKDGRLSKNTCGEIEFAPDGIIGDRHRGYTRENWEGDKQAKGVANRP